MKKIALAAFSATALLALSACGDAAEEPAADDTVSVSEDGVEVDIDDGDTSVEADVDEDPSMTVRD